MSDTAAAARPVLIPGPDHPISITPNPRRVVVSANGKTIAETAAALLLREAAYPAVQYIPRADVDLSMLERSDHRSYCPYKGEAAYFSLPWLDGGENAIWTYETPYDAVAEIGGYLAFYPDRVTLEER